jgi:integrase
MAGWPGGGVRPGWPSGSGVGVFGRGVPGKPLPTSLEFLVSGYYRQAAGLVTATGTAAGPDAALALYLAKADPLMVLRDLLGHSSVTTTEAYLP